MSRSAAALAVRPKKKQPWRDADWQKLWLSIQGKSWSSMAVVPAGAGASADFALTVAVTLARVGTMHLGTPIQVADATKIPLVQLVQFADELERLRQEEELVLVAVAPLRDNPVTVSLTQAADTAILCVLLEQMTYSDAKETVDRIGPSRFVGSAVFHEPPGDG